jgi:hypothetical protein
MNAAGIAVVVTGLVIAAAVSADAEDLAEECIKAIEEYFGGEGQ